MEAGVDAAPQAVAVDTAPSQTDVAPAAVTGEKQAPAATGAKPPGGAATAAADSGLVDSGVAAADAGPRPQECCCEATGHPLESVAMSDCAKVRKGQCVKKERCAADAGPSAAKDAGAPADAGAAQTCCCDAQNKKEIAGMSECTKVRKGQCVKMTLCKP